MKTLNQLHRISPTLLDSFAYYLGNESDDARADMLARIRGTGVTTPAMQGGIDFEAAVVSCDAGVYEGDDEAVFEVAERLQGAIWQQHVEREIAGVVLHGYVDAIIGPRAFDVKTTGKYVFGKYLRNHQHRSYLYCLQPQQIEQFSYVVNCKGNVYVEDYVWSPTYEEDLKAAIAGFYNYLEVDDEMKAAWLDKQERDGANG